MFIDVGADFGTYTIAVGNSAGSNNVKTFTFEPAPPSYALLLTNLMANDLESSTTAFNYALGAQDNTAMLFHFNEKEPGSSGFGLIAAEDVSSFPVPIFKLDTALGSSIEEFDVVYIKMDVEGYESNVIDGAMGLMSRGIPIHILVEDFVDEAVIGKLHSIGAKFESKLSPYNSWWSLNV
jgi:FkbM family methyltransferase